MTEVTGFRASPQQAACWSLQDGAASHPYWASLRLQIDGPCDTAAINARFQALVQAEEILSTRLCAVPGMRLPIQQIGGATAPVLQLGEAQQQDASALQANLWQIGDQRHVLALRAPATHADSASLRLIAAQLIAPGTDSERLQYADYAEWKNTLLETPDAPGTQYWQQQLADPAPPLSLRLGSSGTNGAFQPQSMALATHVDAAVFAAAGYTAAQWLSAAWMIFLSRLSGQSLVEIAYTDSGRGDALDNALGLYELALPVRATIDHQLSMHNQIGALRDAASLALGWRDYHDGGAVPQFGFACVEEPAWPGITVMQEQCIARRFSLRLSVRAGMQRAACAFDYDPALWDAAALQLLAEQWDLFVTALADDSGRPTGGVSLLGPVQRAIVAMPADRPPVEAISIVDLIERQAAQHPAAPALADISATLSYWAMNSRANQLAHRLLRSGVAPGDIVGIVLPRCNDMNVAILAVLKAGAAYLALDPGYPSERLDFMVRDSGVRQVIGYAAQPGTAPHVTIALDQEAPSDAQLPDTNPGLIADLALPAYLIYTSGSSGQPKAVEISHRSLSQSTQVRMAFYRQPVRAFLLLSSFSFDSSVAGIFWTLAQGGKLVLPASGDELVLDTLCNLIEKHAVSHSLSLPSLYGALLDHASPVRLAGIATWIVAGEACTDALVARHHDLLPQASLVNEYGPTEGGVWASAEVLTCARAAGIGRPVAGMTVDLVNEYGAAAAIGETGEIYLAGAQLASGYRGHPEQTAASFASQAHIAGGQRAYRSGDLACWNADGRLHFLGRRDHQVKIRGHRVELAEIERHLLGHGDIGDCVVVAQEQAGGKRLLAYFTGRQASPPDDGALRNYLAERLPAYMVPALFIALRTMPLTPNGKRDVNALPDPDSAARMRDQYVAPRTALEKELADICAGVLRLPRIGVTDNFFQVGGDSILSLQVVTRANRSGITLSTRQVFEHQTVEAMAAVAEWRQADSFEADVGWLQSWTDGAMLDAFALGATRYRMDAGEVLAAALARALLAERDGGPLRLTRLHDGGNGQYVTHHAFQAGDTGWQSFAHEAKAALRREAEAGPAGDVCLAVSEAAGTALEVQPARAQAPLQLAATLLPHALTLAWSADSGHYTEERLHQLSAAVAQGLLELAQHCAANAGAGLMAQDFPAAGLDQDALEELLAELNSDSAS
ncbi:non-ribosomal peptide synthetase [Massilia violaceinigra]|nr:non-ribosomal peptide synthetase [Massilia violaceinigra]